MEKRTKPETQYDQFIEITQALNKRDIIPMIYGSLGLSRYIELPDEIQDLDIAIEERYLDPDRDWDTLSSTLIDIGYKPDRIFPREFSNGNGQAGFEDQEYLIEWAGVDLKQAKVVVESDVKFRELSAEDYLRIYKRYLESNKESVDRAKRKVDAIEEFLRK